jgi:hypothetical protein
VDQKMHRQVAGGGPGWLVAERYLTQRETGDRMIGWGGDNVRSILPGFRSPIEFFGCPNPPSIQSSVIDSVISALF